MDEKLTIGRTHKSGNADLIFAVMVRRARLPLGWRLVPDDEPLSNDWQSDLVFLLTNSLNTGANGAKSIGKEIPGLPNSPARIFVLVKPITTFSVVSALIVYIYMKLSSFHD